MTEIYKITMRGESFELTRDQVEFDSPNYFTSCFLGGFAESQTRTARLSRDPALFKIIQDYLSGYEIFPLHESVIPRRMTLDIALRNLLADAEFYLLAGLVDRIGVEKELQKSQTPANPIINKPDNKYVMFVLPYSVTQWQSPIYISASVAHDYGKKYGPVGLCDRRARWNECRVSVINSLRADGIEGKFLVEAFWYTGDKGFEGASLVLQLV